MHTPSRVTRGGWPQPGPGRRGEGGKPTAPHPASAAQKMAQAGLSSPERPSSLFNKMAFNRFKDFIKNSPRTNYRQCFLAMLCLAIMPTSQCASACEGSRPALSPSVSPRVPASGPCPPSVSPHLSLSLYACPQLCISGSFKVCLPFHTLLCFFLIKYLH